MSGLFVQVGKRIINLAHVARAEKTGETEIRIDYAVPAPESLGGVMGEQPSVATGNLTELLYGDEAAAVWDRLSVLAAKGEEQAKYATEVMDRHAKAKAQKAAS